MSRIDEDVILKLIKDRNVEELDKLETIGARSIICTLKNDIDNLEFFFEWFSKWCGHNMPGSGSYHFENVTNNKTFDIYKKYNFGPENLYRDIVTEEQWKYLTDIGYVSEESEENEESED